MAEYVEVMNQKMRMCNSYDLCSMGCPLNAINFCGKNSGEKIRADFPEVERRVMSWAAEHPESVYPTWYEYLFNVTRGENKWPVDDHEFCQWLDTTRIPAALAQKLGIEPLPKAYRSVKEG